MRGSTSSTYCTPSTVTLTCAMSPSSSPRPDVSGDAVGPDLPWIGARDRAPRRMWRRAQLNSDLRAGQEERLLSGAAADTARQHEHTARENTSQVRIKRRKHSASAEILA